MALGTPLTEAFVRVRLDDSAVDNDARTAGTKAGRYFGGEFDRNADTHGVRKTGTGMTTALPASASTAGKESGRRFGSAFSGAVKGLLVTGAAYFGTQQVIDFLKTSTEEAREAEKVGSRTANVIKTTGGAANVTAKQVGDLAQALSEKVGQDDEAIQSGENLILTFKNIRDETGKGNDIFSQTTGLMIDMSVAMDQDMKSSAIQLGKALNDPTKGISALSRVGVTFSAGQEKQIKHLQKTGDLMGAQKIILHELKSEFGGAGKAMADPADRAKVAWGNLEEDVGTAIMPKLNQLANWFTDEGLPGIRHFAKKYGPDIKEFGSDIFDAAEDMAPAVKDTLPILAEVIGDVAGAFGKFARAFAALPKPLQNAIVTAAIAGYGVRKLTGGSGGLIPPVIVGGGARTAAGTVAGEAAVGGAAAAGAGRMAGIRSLGRTFWPYLLADAGYEALVGDLWGFAPKQGGPRHTGAFGIGAATPGKALTPTDTQTAAEMSGSRFKALHGLGDMFKIDTTPFFGLGNDFEKLDQHLSHIAASNPAKAFNLLHGAAAEAGVPVRMLTDELPSTAKALAGTGVAARFQARQTRDAHDAGQALWDLFRSDLIPSTQSLADKYDLSRKEARNLRGAISDTTGTAKQHEAQLRQVARQLGLDETQTRQLIKAYRDVPDKVQTDAVFKTNDAARARDNFLTQTKGKFSDLGNQTYAIMVNGQSGHGRVFAEGGWTGPGSKYQPAGVVHAEEFVTRRESRSKMEQRFPGALDYINTHGTLPGYFDGGIVGRVNTKVNMDLSALRSTVSQLVKSLQSAGGSVPATLAWVKRQVGDSYQMGGTGPNAWDCSGFMSGITHHLLGQNPVGSRLFATSTFPTSMFARGPGIFMIGSTRDAGGGIGHMAGTLGGVNVESSGDVGVHMGRSARGAHDPLFGGNIWHLKQGLIKQVIAGGRGDPAAFGAGGTPAQNRRLGQQMAAAHGWAGAQWHALNELWGHRESGWRTHARNASGAYGIPQALPGSKMASAGADWHENPGTQIKWGLGYIGGRYGSPLGAIAHSNRYGWYGEGLSGGIFTKPTMIGVGERGPERVDVTPLDNTARMARAFRRDQTGSGRDEPVRIELDIGGGRTLTGVMRGIARDEVDAGAEFDATVGRMGRRS